MLFSNRNSNGNITEKSRGRRHAAVLLSLLFLFSFLCGCGKSGSTTKVVLTTGFAKDEVFKIESMSCRVPEIMLYLTTVQNEYEEVFGEQIFEVSRNGVTLKDNLKETVLARIAQIKTLNLMAQERKVTLDDAEKSSVKAAADTFYASLNDKEIEELNLSEKLIQQMYTEYALAEKVYDQIIQDINPEISDDEARMVTVEQIYIRTYTTDGSGKRVEYAEATKAAAYNEAKEAYALATDGAHDFESVAAQYSESADMEMSIGKGQVSKELEDVVFNMSTGEISSIVEDGDGYHILKCINTYNREETDRNKQTIMEERKREVFGEEYDSYVETLTRTLNEKLWNQIECINDPEVTTSDFFKVFDSYFL